MATAIINSHPSPSFNWADDDDDDFDLESWSARADTSAPSVEDLGPLQRCPTASDPDSEDMFVMTKITSPVLEIRNPDIPVSQAVESQDLESQTPESQAPESQAVESQAPTLPEFEEPIWWHIQQAQHILTSRALDDTWVDAPAYPILSREVGERRSYTLEWNTMKVNSRVDFRFPVLFRGSRLKGVMFVDDTDFEGEKAKLATVIEEEEEDEVDGNGQEQEKVDVEAYERFSEIDLEDLPEGGDGDAEELASSNTSVEDSQDITGTLRAPDTHEIHDRPTSPIPWAADGADFDIADVSEDPPDAEFQDEAYHSSTPPTSPVRPTRPKQEAEASEIPADVFRKRASRNDSMDALADFRNTFSSKDVVEDAIDLEVDVAPSEEVTQVLNNNAILLASSAPPSGTITEASDIPLYEFLNAPTFPALGVKYTTSKHTVVKYFTGMVSTGYFILGVVPWTKYVICAAGTVADGVMGLMG